MMPEMLQTVPFRTMYDSVNLRGIPRTGADMVAYYWNGTYAQSAADVEAQFPHSQHVPIDVLGNAAAHVRVADVESEDIAPEHTEQWITDFNENNWLYEHGARPVIYCNQSTIPAVRKGTGRWLLGLDYFLWIAAPGGMVSGYGIVACQNIWSRTYDSSVVFATEWMPGTP